MADPESIKVAPAMIQAGREILSAWHYHGEDEFVSIDRIVEQIFREMSSASTSAIAANVSEQTR